MNKMKRFLDIYIPTELCNLRCHYCYITQQRKFNNVIAKFSHTPTQIRQALSKKRLDGVCLLNFCAGGETLLSDEVVPIVEELLKEGHYVMIVTNGTIMQRFKEISMLSKDLLKHLFIKFSFHYLELKRLNLIECFFSNVSLIKSVGCSFTIEITPSDELIPYIDEVKRICLEEFGALCHVTIARNDRLDGIDVLSNKTFEEYKQIWNVFDSQLFQFKTELYQKHRDEFCYAGDWSAYLNLETGSLRQCYCGKEIDNIYRDIDKSINFEAVGCNCSIPYCYNGHAFLALGDIPEISSPTFAEERNRVCLDGTEWLSAEMKAFMSSKLYESNRQYSRIKKKRINRKPKSSKRIMNVIKKRLKRLLKKQ